MLENDDLLIQRVQRFQRVGRVELMIKEKLSGFFWKMDYS